MIQFDEHIFQMGWNHHLVYCFEKETAFQTKDRENFFTIF